MKKFLPLLVLLAFGLVFFYRKPDKRINDTQVIGSHNSYKQYIDTALLSLMLKENEKAKSLEYDNISLSDQLSLGLRSLEIDVYADAKGGKFAHPGGLDWVPNNPDRPYDPSGLMKEPGFKVLHMQDVDFRSNCLTLKNCLNELKTWSIAHPGHQPVFITMNAKDDTVFREGFSAPEKFTGAVFLELDKAIRENLGADKLITPDQVRGDYESLEKAVLANNWPGTEEAEGKFLFILDEVGEKRAEYIADNASLKGRMLFVNAPPGTPEAAILIINDPVKELEKIQALVKQGYIVRTRADAETKEARTNDKSRFAAACKSGAQIISTDYYQKSSLFNSPYRISFDHEKYVRNNPILK
jgi:hypothetical protein